MCGRKGLRVAANEVPGPSTAGRPSGRATTSSVRLVPRCTTRASLPSSGPWTTLRRWRTGPCWTTLADDVSCRGLRPVRRTGAPAPESTALLASVGLGGAPVARHARRDGLPGRPAAGGIARHPDSRYLVIAERRRQVLARLARRPRATVVQASLPPVARSARAARDLVARTLLDWGCGPQIGGATLVVSELVTHAMLYADSDLLVTVARCGPQLRISVRDANRTNIQLMGAGPGAHQPSRSACSSRPCRSPGGSCRPAIGGKVVWAVLAANPRSIRTRPARRAAERRAHARPRARADRTRADDARAGGAVPLVGDTMAAPTSLQLVRVLTTAEWMRSGAPLVRPAQHCRTSASTTVSA